MFKKVVCLFLLVFLISSCSKPVENEPEESVVVEPVKNYTVFEDILGDEEMTKYEFTEFSERIYDAVSSYLGENMDYSVRSYIGDKLQIAISTSEGRSQFVLDYFLEYDIKTDEVTEIANFKSLPNFVLHNYINIEGRQYFSGTFLGVTDESLGINDETDRLYTYFVYEIKSDNRFVLLDKGQVDYYFTIGGFSNYKNNPVYTSSTFDGKLDDIMNSGNYCYGVHQINEDGSITALDEHCQEATVNYLVTTAVPKPANGTVVVGGDNFAYYVVWNDMGTPRHTIHSSFNPEGIAFETDAIQSMQPMGDQLLIVHTKRNQLPQLDVLDFKTLTVKKTYFFTKMEPYFLIKIDENRVVLNTSIKNDDIRYQSQIFQLELLDDGSFKADSLVETKTRTGDGHIQLNGEGGMIYGGKEGGRITRFYQLTKPLN